MAYHLTKAPDVAALRHLPVDFMPLSFVRDTSNFGYLDKNCYQCVVKANEYYDGSDVMDRPDAMSNAYTEHDGQYGNNAGSLGTVYGLADAASAYSQSWGMPAQNAMDFVPQKTLNAELLETIYLNRINAPGEFYLQIARDVEDRFSQSITNSKGQVVASWSFDGAAEMVVLYEYDENDLLIKEYPKNNPALGKEYGYDALGRVISYRDSDRGETKTVYDKYGRARFTQNATQRALGANYFSVKIFDSIGRVEAVGEVQGQYSFTNPDADIPGSDIKLHERFIYGKPTPTALVELLSDNTLADSILAAMENIKALDVGAHITYGADGNMTSVSMASYDRMGQKNKQWMVYGLGGLPAVQLYYNYNAAGELVNSFYSQWENDHWQAKSQRKRQYNSQGRLTHTFEVVNGADKLMASYEYTANGNTKNKSYYDQGSEVFTKQILTDIHGRPTQLKYTKGNAPLYTQSLTYEKPWASRMQVVNHDYHQLNHSGGASVLNYHYSYDYLGRLSQVSGPKNASYSYDNLGRLTSKFEDNIGVGYAYSPDRYRPKHYDVTGSAHQVAFDYDSSGNVWFDQYRSTAYKLDAAGLPLTAYKLKQNATYNQVTNGTLPESHYGDKLEMAYSGGNRLWYSYHSDDNMSYTEATFSGVGVYKSIDSSDFNLQRLDLIGGGYRNMNQNGEGLAYFPITDAQGNVRMYANRQEVVSAYDYLPYGMTITLKEDSETDRKRWQSKEYDGEHDKYYFGARYFDPLFGLWLSPDPAGQFANPYSYGNDPINYIDPNGESVVIGALVVGAVIGGITGGVKAHNRGYGLSDWESYAYVVGGAALGGLAGGYLAPTVATWATGATGLATANGYAAAIAGGAASSAVGATINTAGFYAMDHTFGGGKWKTEDFFKEVGLSALSGVLIGGATGAVGYKLSDRLRYETDMTVLEYANKNNRLEEAVRYISPGDYRVSFDQGIKTSYDPIENTINMNSSDYMDNGKFLSDKFHYAASHEANHYKMLNAAYENEIGLKNVGAKSLADWVDKTPQGGTFGYYHHTQVQEYICTDPHRVKYYKYMSEDTQKFINFYWEKAKESKASIKTFLLEYEKYGF